MPWFLSAVRPDIWHKNWFSLQIRRIHRAKAFLEFNWPFWLLFCITKSGLETFRYNQVNLWAINSAIQKQTILPLKHINFGFCKKINIIIAILPCFSYSEKKYILESFSHNEHMLVSKRLPPFDQLHGSKKGTTFFMMVIKKDFPMLMN